MRTIAASMDSGAADAQSHGHPDRQAKLVCEDDIRGIGDRHQDRPVLAEADRQSLVVTGEILGKHHRGRDVDQLQVELDELQLMLLGDRAGDVE